ncbi:hypothetical protein NUM3379_21170 [Kineococcus sp. NUM-3379]
MRTERTAALARSAAFAVLFCVAVYLGRLTVMDGTSLSLVWPAAGVAALWFAAQRAAGTRVFDLAALAAATLLLNVATGSSWLLAACFVVANVVQVTVFGALFARWCPQAWGAGGREALTGSGQLARLLAAATVGTAAGCALGPTSVWLLTGHWSWLTAAVWMTRNTASVVLVAAVGFRVGAVLTARRARRRGTRAARVPVLWPTGWRLVELAAVGAASAIAYGLLFGLLDGLPVAFPLLVLTIWVAVRFDTTIVAVHSLLTGIAAVLFTLAGNGPFATIGDDATRALVVQAYVGLVAAVGLALALGRDERDVLVAQVRARADEADEQRTLAEIAMAEAEARSELAETLTDAVDVGIVVAGADGRLVQFNRTARAWHGLDADASLDPREHAGVYGLRGPDGRTPLREEDVPLTRALREGSVHGAEIVLAPVGREAVVVVCSGRAMHRADGTLLGAVVAMTDVTAARARQRELEATAAELAERSAQLTSAVAELERSNADLAHFAGVASHDLNSPLTVVAGYLEMIGETYGEELGAQGRDWVGTALKGTGRMKDLISALLAHAKAGGSSGAREATDVRDVFDQALLDLRAPVVAARARVAAGPLPTLWCDPVLLRQLLQNLIGNAVKYRAPGRPCLVALSAEPSADGWTFSVTDNGVGIPEELRAHVFGMFAQVDPAARTGHGIGLATCQRIVERHGGRIWVEGTPGGGTTVRFTLPQRDPERAAPSGDAPAGAVAGQEVPLPLTA